MFFRSGNIALGCCFMFLVLLCTCCLCLVVEKITSSVGCGMTISVEGFGFRDTGGFAVGKEMIRLSRCIPGTFSFFLFRRMRFRQYLVVWLSFLDFLPCICLELKVTTVIYGLGGKLQRPGLRPLVLQKLYLSQDCKSDNLEISASRA